MVAMMWLLMACSVPAQDGGRCDAAAQWLDRIEQQARQIETLTAKLTYTREQGLLGDRQHRYGTLVYDSGPPARFQVRFDRLAVDGALHEMDTAYVFDGRYLVERDNDERIWTRWELAAEDEELDLLALGEGPFALPLNMRRDRVLERFEATVGEEDEQGALVHLVLTPRPELELDVTRVELWFDRDTLLPVRARQEEGADATDVTLRELAVNPQEAEEGTFDTAPPPAGQRGWQINDHPRAREEAQKTPESPDSH